MTIYDLDKQATPGRWTVNESDPSWPMHSYELDGQFFTVEERANALLSAHCRNHFMEALTALKEEHENHEYHHDAGNCGPFCPVCKLIAKLEEVK